MVELRSEGKRGGESSTDTTPAKKAKLVSPEFSVYIGNLSRCKPRDEVRLLHILFDDTEHIVSRYPLRPVQETHLCGSGLENGPS
ncbi:hypothetical protein OJAV_G00167380 [Oryzias javanicus]|uniref:Uncharacterized protein n=1 Tax=Oryzias javanicus TaxID=123683 RepID=A0A3S2LTZ6_ORYJA|nr:hypothetical protein OJAV_G00167380 [Oryzias javanicus]